VEGQAGVTRRKIVISHRSDPSATGVLLCCQRFPLLQFGAVWFAAVSVANRGLA
jgi:hypothetical protein